MDPKINPNPGGPAYRSNRRGSTNQQVHSFHKLRQPKCLVFCLQQDAAPLGAKPVNAVASADKPDSRLVISEVQEFEKQTAFDSAHEATPEVNSIPRS